MADLLEDIWQKLDTSNDALMLWNKICWKKQDFQKFAKKIADWSATLGYVFMSPSVAGIEKPTTANLSCAIKDF